MKPGGAAFPSNEIAFEAFGVRLLVSVPTAEIRDRVTRLLPPESRACPVATVQQRFAIVEEESGVFRLAQGEEALTPGLPLELTLERLEARLRAHVALHAPDHIFVHAGVVGVRGRAVVLPGESFAGKSTIVAALVRGGATYYSDEFAVLDADGLVHPYGKPLSLRRDTLEQVDHPVEALGGVQGREPLPMGLIVVTSFRPGAEWDPRATSPGDGVMALLENTIAAQERPSEVMRVLARAAEGATVIRGDRGEATELVPRILQLLED